MRISFREMFKRESAEVSKLKKDLADAQFRIRELEITKEYHVTIIKNLNKELKYAGILGKLKKFIGF